MNELLSMLIGICLGVFVGINLQSGVEQGYKQGQIDAVQGKWSYKPVTNIVWEAK